MIIDTISPEQMTAVELASTNLRELATIRNNNRSRGPSRARPDFLDGLYHIHAFDDLTEHDVLSIAQVGGQAVLG